MYCVTARFFRRLGLSAAGSLALGATAAAAGAAFNDPADLKAINDAEQVLQSGTDMKELIGYYAPNAFVEDIISPGVYRGRQAIEENFEEQLKVVKTIHPDFQDTSIASDGKFACAALRIHFKSEMKDGSKIAMSVRELDVFKKLDDKWLIVQQHISVPMDGKTGMALMNVDLPVRGPMTWPQDPFSGTPTTPDKAKAEIKQWLIRGAPTVDIDQMLSYLGPGDQALIYDLTAPGEYRGLSEIRAAYAPQMSTLASAKMTLLDFVVDSDGEFGAQIDTQNLELHGKDGSTKTIYYRESDCMHRVDGKWQAFFEMLSFPADPKTGKSVTVDPAQHAAK